MLSKSTTILLVTIGLTMLLLLSLWLIGRENAKAGNELVRVLQTLNDEQETAREQRILVDLLASTESSRKEMQSRVVSGDDGAIQFLSLMDETAKNLGVSLETKQLTVVKGAKDPYDGLSVSYSFEGDEQNVRLLIKALERVPYSSSVESLNLTKVDNKQTGLTTVEGSATILLSMTQS